MHEITNKHSNSHTDTRKENQEHDDHKHVPYGESSKMDIPSPRTCHSSCCSLKRSPLPSPPNLPTPDYHCADNMDVPFNYKDQQDVGDCLNLVPQPPGSNYSEKPPLTTTAATTGKSSLSYSEQKHAGIGSYLRSCQSAFVCNAKLTMLTSELADARKQILILEDALKMKEVEDAEGASSDDVDDCIDFEPGLRN